MNIILAIKPEYAAAILDGTKLAELRSYIPAKLLPGDTIFLVGGGRMWGHCTFAGATPMPPPGLCRDKWLNAVAALAAVPVSVATSYLVRPGATGYAWHLRYPVRYNGEAGYRWLGATIQRFTYTQDSPTAIHPALENYLLYLQTHKQ